MFLECCRASVLRLSSARKASKISDANVVGLVFLECCRTSVLRLSGARNASKISDAIFVSDASNASLAKVDVISVGDKLLTWLCSTVFGENCMSVSFSWISSQLMKSQGDLCINWIIRNR